MSTHPTQVDAAETTTAANTRERILQETLRLMVQQRGQGVRLEDVARAAKVSRQAVYLHFGSRTELLVAAARYLDERLQLRERLQQVCQARSATEAIDAYAGFWAGYIPEIYGLAKALLSMRETDKAAAAAWADRMAALYDGCRTIVRAAEDEGLLAPGWAVETATDFFWAALSIETWEHLTIERGWTPAHYLERLRWVIRWAIMR